MGSWWQGTIALQLALVSSPVPLHPSRESTSAINEHVLVLLGLPRVWGAACCPYNPIHSCPVMLYVCLSLPVMGPLVHAAVLAINEAVERGVVEQTLAALHNPSALLLSLRDDLAAVYQEMLYQAKAEKAGNAQNRVRAPCWGKVLAAAGGCCSMCVHGRGACTWLCPVHFCGVGGTTQR